MPALPKGSSVLPRLLQDPARLSSALDIATYKGILVQKRARCCCSDTPQPAGRAGPQDYKAGNNKVASHSALCRLSLPQACSKRWRHLLLQHADPHLLSCTSLLPCLHLLPRLAEPWHVNRRGREAAEARAAGPFAMAAHWGWLQAWCETSPQLPLPQDASTPQPDDWELLSTLQVCFFTSSACACDSRAPAMLSGASNKT